MGPIHPASTTCHVENAGLWLTVDGETKQDSDVSHLLWSVAETVAICRSSSTSNRAVFPDYMKLIDALDAKEVVHINVGVPYRERFGNPYAVIHRADIRLSILEAVKGHPLSSARTQRGFEIAICGCDCGLHSDPSAHITRNVSSVRSAIRC